MRKEKLMIVSIFSGSHVDVWHDCNKIDTDFQHMSSKNKYCSNQFTFSASKHNNVVTHLLNQLEKKLRSSLSPVPSPNEGIKAFGYS